MFEALCEGGPTKRAGAGRRLACTFVALLLLVAMVVVLISWSDYKDLSVDSVRLLSQQQDTEYLDHIGAVDTLLKFKSQHAC